LSGLLENCLRVQANLIAIARHELPAAIELHAINERPLDKGPI